MLRRTVLRSAFALAFAASLAVPAAADWLQTTDGALVETRGPWTVQGRIVVFTSPQGTLSSLRLSQVDLDASAVATFEAAATSEAAERSSSPEAEEKAPVLVLTNKNIPKARRSRAVEPGEELGADTVSAEDTEASLAGPGAAPGAIDVISWHVEESDDLGGVEVLGKIQNRGRDIETDVRVMVRLFDTEGKFLGAANAFLGALSLAPNVTANLRAIFPGVNTSELDPRFEVRSSSIKIEGVTPQQAPGSES